MTSLTPTVRFCGLRKFSAQKYRFKITEKKITTTKIYTYLSSESFSTTTTTATTRKKKWKREVRQLLLSLHYLFHGVE